MAVLGRVLSRGYTGRKLGRSFSEYSEDLSNWILDKGYWNDNGIWVDSDVWKDN